MWAPDSINPPVQANQRMKGIFLALLLDLIGVVLVISGLLVAFIHSMEGSFCLVNKKK